MLLSLSLRRVKNTYKLICSFDRGTFRCSFSDTPFKRIVLSEVAQKAVLAALIIKTIAKANSPKSVQDSLRDEVLSLQKKISSKYYDFDIIDECKDQIFSIFDTGIVVRNRGYCQKRVFEAQIEGKVAFFPTYTVTRYIFGLILSPFSTNYILIGSDGIGKTFSYLLYSILSSKVNHLKCLATAPWIDQKDKQKYKWEYDMLIEKKYIQQLKKIWYYNIQIELQCQQQLKKPKHSQVIKLMMQQIDELCLPEFIIASLKNSKDMPQFVEYLNQIGVKDTIDSIIVLDQINKVASLYRDLNKKIHDEMDNGKSEIQAKQPYLQTIIDATRISALLRNIKSIGTRSFLNSSVYMEQQIISRPTEAMKKYLIVKFRFYEHGEPTTMQLKYNDQMMQSKETRIEFCQLFLFLLQLYCGQVPMLKQNFEDIKKRLTLEEFIIKNYYRFLLIREYFAKAPRRTGLQRLTQKISQRESTEFIKEFSNGFHQFCLQESKKRLKDYLQKDKLPHITFYKNFIVRIMNLQAKRCGLRGQQKVSIPVYKLERFLEKYTKKRGKQLKQIDIQELLTSKDYNSQTFSFNYNKEKKIIEYDWPTLEFIQITDYALFSIDLRSKNLKLCQQFATMIQQDESYAGMTGEGLIRQLLRHSLAVQFKLFQDLDKAQKYKTVNHDIYDTVKFVPFNEESQVNKVVTKKRNSKIQGDKRIVKKTASLQHNLKQILSKAKQQPGRGFYGQPFKIKKKNDVQQIGYETKSKCIDFLFVKYSKQQNIFDITTIDVTVSPTKARSKRIFAEAMLKKLFNKVNKYKNIKQLSSNIQHTYQQKSTIYIQDNTLDHNNYRINHIILCPLQYCQGPKIVAQGILTMSYYPIELIKFIECKDRRLLSIFQQSLKIMSLTAQE